MKGHKDSSGKFHPHGSSSGLKSSQILGKKKNSSLGYAFGKMKRVNAHDIPITPPPNAPKCKKCGGGLNFFDNRTVCRKCKNVVKD